MKIIITDVVLREREVDVPCSCPHCNAYLGDGKGMQLCFYEYTFYRSRPVNGFIGYVFEEVEPEGDVDAPCLGAYCLSCGEPVIEGKVKRLPSVVVEKSELASTWSASLDCLVFKDS